MKLRPDVAVMRDHLSAQYLEVFLVQLAGTGDHQLWHIGKLSRVNRHGAMVTPKAMDQMVPGRMGRIYP